MLKGGLAAESDLERGVSCSERPPLGIGVEAGGIRAEGLG